MGSVSRPAYSMTYYLPHTYGVSAQSGIEYYVAVLRTFSSLSLADLSPTKLKSNAEGVPKPMQ